MAQTINYSWTYPTVGADLDTWGGILNAAFVAADASLKTVNNIADAALPRAGGTMTGDLVLAGAPDADLKAATKLYVDTLVAPKAPSANPVFTGDAQFARARTPSVAVAPVANILNVDLSLSNAFRVTVDQSIGTFNLNGPADGQTIVMRLTHTSGAEVITWPTNFRWVGGNFGVGTVIAGRVDLLVGTYWADTGVWLVNLTRDHKAAP